MPTRGERWLRIRERWRQIDKLPRPEAQKPAPGVTVWRGGAPAPPRSEFWDLLLGLGAIALCIGVVVIEFAFFPGLFELLALIGAIIAFIFGSKTLGAVFGAFGRFVFSAGGSGGGSGGGATAGGGGSFGGGGASGRW